MTWETNLALFWRTADDSEPDNFRRRLDALLRSRPQNEESRELFERASAEDFLGDEHAAVPLYELALEGHLDRHIAQRARIQLASSLRNTGRASDALAVLTDTDFDTEYESAAAAFTALSHWDLGNHALSLCHALKAADPALGRYGRAVRTYARELEDTSAPPATPGKSTQS